MLSSVAGVALIVDTDTGKRAYGAEGIWGHWAAYSKNDSGGNIEAKKYFIADGVAVERLRYSILQVREPCVTKDEVLVQEVLLKKKLGSRALGLNGN